ncbi:hypothetical protein EGW08_006590, partial [Elysia chlorotica]
MSGYNNKPTMAYDNSGFDRGNDYYDNFAGGRLHVKRGASRQLGPVARVLVPLTIMSIEVFERMAYFTIAGGILHYSVLNLGYNMHSGGILFLALFSGGAYLTAPLGGYIADAFLGRFYTILTSAFIYIAGLAVLIAGSFDSSKLNLDTFELGQRNIMAIAGLSLVALATGGIKANVGPFGADQICSLGDGTVTSYFNWYYFVINLGSASAVMGVSHLQSEMFMGSGLMVPLCGMAVALLVFAGMHKVYLKYRPERYNMCKIMCQGCSKCTYEGICCAGSMERFGGTYSEQVVIGFSSALKAALLAIFLTFVWIGISMFVFITPYQSMRMDRYVGSLEVPEYVYKAFPRLAVLLAIPLLALAILPLFSYRGKFSLTMPRMIG